MRAWVLILAVLTTLKPITQVVSTEGNINLYNNTDTKSKYNNTKENYNIITLNKNENNNKNNNISSSPVILNNINNNNSINNNIHNNQTNSSHNNNSNTNNINILYNKNNKYINNNSQNKLDISRINSSNNNNNNNNNNENNSTLIKNKLDKQITNNNQNSSKNNNENNNNNNISNKNNYNNNIENIENLTTNNIKENNKNIISKSNEMQINNYDTVESEDNNSNSNNENINNLDSNENNDKLKPDPETLVQIETSLLSLFGLKKPPKIDRSKIVIPEAMKRLYAQIMGHEYDTITIPKPGLHTHSANTVRSFTHESSDTDEKFKYHHKFRLFFNVNSIPNEEKLKAAELQISRDKIDIDNPNILQKRQQRFRVSVYDIIKIGNNNKKNYQHGDTSYLLLDTKTIYLNSSETLSLDVHTAVNRWLESPDDNNGLLIDVKTARTLKPARHNHVRLRRSLDETQSEWLPKQPLLFTYTDDDRHKTRLIRDVNSQRSKRAHPTRNSHHKTKKNKICQRRPLYVDFNDVGWSDWIVAPPGYDAYYCQGDCPFPLTDHLNSTNHAVVQTLVNSITQGAKVPKACCIPTQLSAISMLYLNDQNQVVLKNYQDMTVVGCGCR